jgi:hypothetical protein
MGRSQAFQINGDKFKPSTIKSSAPTALESRGFSALGQPEVCGLYGLP